MVRLAFNFVLVLVIVWIYFLDLFGLSGMLNCVDCLDWFCDALTDLFLCIVSWIFRDFFGRCRTALRVLWVVSNITPSFQTFSDVLDNFSYLSSLVIYREPP